MYDIKIYSKRPWPTQYFIFFLNFKMTYVKHTKEAVYRSGVIWMHLEFIYIYCMLIDVSPSSTSIGIRAQRSRQVKKCWSFVFVFCKLKREPKYQETSKREKREKGLRWGIKGKRKQGERDLLEEGEIYLLERYLYGEGSSKNKLLVPKCVYTARGRNQVDSSNTHGEANTNY